MKVYAEPKESGGFVLVDKDGNVLWDDEWAQYAPEDCTVGRDVGALLRAVGVEVEVKS